LRFGLAGWIALAALFAAAGFALRPVSTWAQRRFEERVTAGVGA
jgi:hypothetical protein